MISSTREVNVGRDALERQLPPMLMAGDVIQFRRPSHLGAFLGEELANNRLMAVDLIGAPLYKQVLFSVQIQGEPGNVTHIPGSVVHRQGDVVGLHLQCSDVILETIERFLRATGWSPPKPSRPSKAAPQESAPPITLGPVETLLVDDDDDDFDDDDEEWMDQSVQLTALDPDYQGLLVGGLFDDESNGDEPHGVEASDGGDDDEEVIVASMDEVGFDAETADDPDRLPVEHGALQAVGSPHDLVRGRTGLTLFSLLLSLQRNCRPGRLTLLLPSGPWGAYLDHRGCVCEFDGDLGTRLIDEGVLTADWGQRISKIDGVIAQARAARDPHVPGEPIPLRMLRALARDALVDLLMAHANHSDLRFVFDPNDQGTSIRELRIPFLGYARNWLSMSLSQLRSDDLDTLFGDDFDTFPTLTEDARWQPSMLQLDRQEMKFAEVALPKGLSLRRLLTISPVSRNRTLRLLALLDALEMVSYADVPATDDDAFDIPAVVAARYLRGQANHFAALGVHLTAHEQEFDDALARVKARFGAGTTMATHSPECRNQCAGIIKLAMAAHAVLKDRRQRIEYRRERYTATELSGFAALLVDKMHLARFRGRERRAVRFHEVAKELDPRIQ